MSWLASIPLLHSESNRATIDALSERSKCASVAADRSAASARVLGPIRQCRFL